MTTEIVHDPYCATPLSEHTGFESCLHVIEREDPKPIPPAHYTEGSQGQQISDYRADYRARYGTANGEIKSTVEDRRDNRDPLAVGTAYLVERAAKTNGVSHA